MKQSYHILIFLFLSGMAMEDARPALHKHATSKKKSSNTTLFTLTKKLAFATRHSNFAKLTRLIALTNDLKPHIPISSLRVPVTTYPDNLKLYVSLLHLAAVQQRTNIIDFFVEQGHIPITTLSAGYTPLAFAAVNNKKHAVTHILEKYRISGRSDASFARLLPLLIEQENWPMINKITGSSDCVICLEPFASFRADQLTLTPCLHIFCSADINRVNVCPLCRKKLPHS